MNPTLNRFLDEFYAFDWAGDEFVTLPPKDLHALRSSLESQWMHCFQEDASGSRFMGIKIIVDKDARSIQLPH